MHEPDINRLHLDRPGVLAALGDLEANVMEAVWARAPGEGITVREVWDEIRPRRPIMYTTVMNTMTRLARKGLLTTERKGPAYRYQATMTREAFVDRFVAGALERLLLNFAGPTSAYVTQVHDPAVQLRLERLLEDIRRQRSLEEPK